MGKPSWKAIHIIKRSLKFSTKPLSLDSTILVDELTAETFYHFKTSKLFNIWTPPFLLHGSQYVTNQKCTTPSTWLTHQLEEDVGCKVLHFINKWRSRSTWLQNPKAQRCNSFFSERIRHQSPFSYVLLVFSYVTVSKISLIYV